MMLPILILHFVINESIKAEQILADVQNRLGTYISHDIEKTIRAKVAELKPFLDDNKRDEKENVQIDEVLAKHGLRRSSNAVNKKYEVRKEIEELLKIEALSEVTKVAVNNALDQITDEMISKECLWKKKLEEDENPMTIDHTELNKKHIKEKWNTIINKYSLKNIVYNDTEGREFVMLTVLRQFISDVHEDNKKLENQYGLKCGFVDFNELAATNGSKANSLNRFVESAKCNVRICSAELLIFLLDFYNQLFGTVNYVFNHNDLRINMDGRRNRRNKQQDETSNITTTPSTTTVDDSAVFHVNRIKAQFDDKIKEVFETGEALPNLLGHIVTGGESLKNGIENTIDTAKKFISKHKIKLPFFRRTAIDLQIIALENLKQDMKDRICTAFKTCNGVAWPASNTSDDSAN